MLSHHAQLIEGSSGHIGPVLDILSQKYGLYNQHPDLTVRAFEHEKFGVEDAHNIHEILIKKPAQANWNVVVVYAHTLTEQAQNTLLKILEEPPVHTRFILITDSIHPLLPTLRSRLNLFNLEACIATTDSSIAVSGSHVVKEKSSYLDAQAFLDADVASRLDIVKKIHTDLDKEKMSIAEVFHFVNEIESLVYGAINQGGYMGKGKGGSTVSVGSNHSAGEINRKLNALVKVQTYMHMPGNSVKMLLEYLATML